MRIVISAPAAAAITRAFAEAPELVMDELDTAMGNALTYLQGQVIERTPEHLGTLRSAFIPSVTRLVDAVFGQLRNPLPYALPVEMGTRPHWPPYAPILAWVEAKLGLDGDEAESAATGIQRKIARFGTPGYGMVRFALIDGASTIVGEFEEAADRIVGRLAGTAGGAA
jgi:hypothetical protein